MELHFLEKLHGTKGDKRTIINKWNGVLGNTTVVTVRDWKNILQSWEKLWWCGTRSRAWMSAKNWTKAKLTLAKMATILLAAEGAMEDSQGSNGTSNCGSNAIGSSSVDCIGISSGVPTGFLLPSHNLSHAHTITTH